MEFFFNCYVYKLSAPALRALLIIIISINEIIAFILLSKYLFLFTVTLTCTKCYLNCISTLYS